MFIFAYVFFFALYWSYIGNYIANMYVCIHTHSVSLCLCLYLCIHMYLHSDWILSQWCVFSWNFLSSMYPVLKLKIAPEDNVNSFRITLFFSLKTVNPLCQNCIPKEINNYRDGHIKHTNLYLESKQNLKPAQSQTL